MSELPKGWAETSLSNIVVKSLGGDWGKDCNEALKGYEKVRVVRGTDFKDWKAHRATKAAERCIKQSSLASRQLAEGDIIVEVSGGGPTQPVGRSILIDKATIDNSPLPLVCSNFFRQVRLHQSIEPAYVKDFISHAYFKGEFDEFQTQTTNLRNLNFTKFLEGVGIDVPPFDEQRRIVAQLEKLLSRLDAAQARLAKIPRILKRFRQSVLASACSGRLTVDWREQNQRTFDGLQHKSEQKYELDENNLPDIPSTWSWLLLDDVAAVIDPQPSHRTPPQVEGGTPYVGMGDITQTGKIDFANARLVSSGVFREHLERYRLSKGDFIFGKIGTLGKPVKLPEPFNYTLSANVVLVQPGPNIANAGFVFLYMQSPEMNRMLMSENRATSQPAFGIKRIRTLPFPLPPREEQLEIVRRVEALSKTADALEARYRKAKAHVDKLTQSILAKAFRGELVPQDSNDEPASVLLERIKAAGKSVGPANGKRKAMVELP